MNQKLEEQISKLKVTASSLKESINKLKNIKTPNKSDQETYNNLYQILSKDAIKHQKLIEELEKQLIQ
jgi:dTDP-4-amino-4,6-dideoxygalactose transaminase